jgi:hypothetical protein
MNRNAPEHSRSRIDDEWQRQATAAAIARARDMIGDAIPAGVPIGRLNEREWGFITAAILFGWIETRARQATAEGFDIEQACRETGEDPEPWDIGTIETILPDLAEASPTLDWSQPVGNWPREVMAKFLFTALRLVQRAITACNGDEGITRKKQLDDEIPF